MRVDNKRLLALASAMLAAGIGLAWMLPMPWVGPALSVLLIPLVLLQDTRRRRYAVAIAYYLAGSSGIPQASAVFFGPGGHSAEGMALWIASSALLAFGWAFADKPWKAALVLLFDALIPPLAFFDWMSPLSASGVFFPKWGIFGVAALLSGMALFPLLRRKHAGELVLLLLPAWANLVFMVSPVPETTAFLGLNTHVGPSTHSVLANFSRMQHWTSQADNHTKAKVILLPETLLTWWTGNQNFIQSRVPAGQTWLVGASIPLKKGWFADGIEAVTSHGSQRIFASVLPVPVSMWRPWHTPSRDSFGYNNYKAFWWQEPVKIAGKMTWAEICYDQLLPFSWLEASLYHPQVVLLTNNVWWARGTGIPEIQRSSAWAWTRLIGATDIEAENE